MKHNFKLLAASLMAAFSCANATADGWEAPTPKASALTSGNTYYLFNVGYKKFINEGEAWGTQAIVANEGLAAKVDAVADGVYTITFLNTAKGTHRQYFRTSTDAKVGSGVKAAFVDGSGKAADCTQWTITEAGGGSYVIGLPADNANYVDGEALGVDTLHAGSVKPTYGTYWDIPSTTDDAHWQFVSEEHYKHYAARLEAYNTSGLLAAEIEKAEEEGLNTAAAEAVYNNHESTKADMEAAISDLYQQRANQGSVNHPVDVTGLICNPTFHTNTDGWTSTTGAASNKLASNQQGDFTVPFYENWKPAGSGLMGKMRQKLSALPQGVYLLKAAASAQNQNTAMNDEGTYLYGNDYLMSVTTVEPTFHQVFVPVNADTLEIGLLMNENNTNNWVGMDNYSLAYYGNTLESYTNMATLFDGWEDQYAEEACAPSVKENLANAIAALTGSADIESAIVNYQVALAGLVDIRQNVAAYSRLAELVDATFSSGVVYDPLSELLVKAQEMTVQNTASTAEVNKMITDLINMIDEANRNALAPGDDATALIKNAAFTESDGAEYNGFGSWTLTGDFSNNGKPNTGSGVAEVWKNGFELSQTITGLQSGVYRLSAQAFYRSPESGDRFGAWKNGADVDSEISTIFAGDSETGLKNIFSGRQAAALGSGNESADIDGMFSPDDKASAAAYFAQGLYPNEVYGIVTDGTLKIGIRGKVADTWTLWGPMTLTFAGKDVNVLTEVLNTILSDANSVAEQLQGATEKRALTAAIAAAQQAVSTNDGTVMFDGYQTLTAAIAASKTSVGAYSELDAANKALADNIDTYAELADPEAVKTAIALNAEVTDALTAGSYSADEANAKLDEVISASKDLKKVAASDDQPADYTFLIVNPDYANGTTGWTVAPELTAKTGIQNNIMEGYNGTFDIYQDIKNVPAGTYKVSLRGFYRMGNADNAVNAYKADTTALNAKAYANADSLALTNVIVVNESAQSAALNGWSTIEEGENKYFFPSTRQTARDRFDADFYLNEFFVNVGEDGKLRLGFCNYNAVTDDWAVATDWALTYYGKNSAHAVETGVTTITAGQITDQHIYNVNGMKIGRLQKGVNIIRTVSADGKVSVRKVFVK